MVDGDDLIVTLRGSSDTLGSNPTVRIPADQRREILAQLQREGLEIVTSVSASLAGELAQRQAQRIQRIAEGEIIEAGQIIEAPVFQPGAVAIQQPTGQQFVVEGEEVTESMFQRSVGEQLAQQQALPTPIVALTSQIIEAQPTPTVTDPRLERIRQIEQQLQSEGIAIPGTDIELAIEETKRLATFGLVGGQSLLLERITIKKELGIELTPAEKAQEAILPVAAAIPSGIGAGVVLGALGTLGTVVGIGAGAVAAPSVVRGILDPTTRIRTISELGGFVIGGGIGAKGVSGVNIIQSLLKKVPPSLRKIRTTPQGKQFVDLKSPSGETVSVELLQPGLEKASLSIPEQIQIAGTRRTVVSGARDFFGIFEGQKIIEKPTTPGSPALERALFADPLSRLRLSRLGLEVPRTASLSDIASGNVQLRATRPQALIFENIDVAPLSPRLQTLLKQAQAGDVQARVRFQEEFLPKQLTPTGEFQAIGFLSREAEVTLAPGSLVKKTGSLGKRLVEGRTVDFVKTEIVEATPQTKSLLKKFRDNTITKSEMRELTNRVRRESKGLKFETATGRSRGIVEKPVLRTAPFGVGSDLLSSSAITLPSAIPAVSAVSPIPSALPSIAPISLTGLTPSVPPSAAPPSVPISPLPSPTPSLLPSITPTPSPVPSPAPSIIPSLPPTPPPSPPPSAPPVTIGPPSPPVTPSITPTPTLIPEPSPIQPPTVMEAIKKIKKWDLFVRREGKFNKIGESLTRNRQIQKGARIVRDELSATFRVKPTKKDATREDISFIPNPQIFRQNVIRKGVRIPTPHSWIERRSFRLDSTKEVIDIQAAKRAAPKKKKQNNIMEFMS